MVSSPINILSKLSGTIRWFCFKVNDVDLLEDMSFAEGEAYNNKLIPIARGDVLPDRE